MLAAGAARKELITITSDSVELEGMLEVPAHARGLVLFAHGSGSSRHSSRNNYVAEVLRAAGMGTLLFDLLTEEEAMDRRNVFDIDLLAERLVAATDWVTSHRKELSKIGYFGASTGGAAALQASVMTSAAIAAIVSRGGRPDMVLPILNQVKAPTLLLVGGDDRDVIALNKLAYQALGAEKELTIIPGATHLFEEPGKLEEVARLASVWFQKHLA